LELRTWGKSKKVRVRRRVGGTFSRRGKGGKRGLMNGGKMRQGPARLILRREKAWTEKEGLKLKNGGTSGQKWDSSEKL